MCHEPCKTPHGGSREDGCTRGPAEEEQDPEGTVSRHPGLHVRCRKPARTHPGADRVWRQGYPGSCTGLYRDQYGQPVIGLGITFFGNSK